jgi:hypothetical protein
MDKKETICNRERERERERMVELARYGVYFRALLLYQRDECVDECACTRAADYVFNRTRLTYIPLTRNLLIYDGYS